MKIRQLTALLLLLTPAAGYGFDIIFDQESLYHHIRVTENGGYRFLSFDETRGTQSTMKISDPLYLDYVYTRLAFAGLAFCNDEPKDVAFVGLGGATMPKFFRHHYPEANIDVAEIDQMVVEVAKKHFAFTVDERMKIHVRDGRVFLSKTEKKYDLIFLDAYNTRSIPFHLTTKEFMEIVRSRLKPDGAVVANIWSPGLNRYFEAEIKTFRVVFPEMYIFRGLTSGNYIFIATNKTGRIPLFTIVDRLKRINYIKKLPFDLPGLVKSTYSGNGANRAKGARVLTDDHAPVNVMRRRDGGSEGGGI